MRIFLLLVTLLAGGVLKTFGQDNPDDKRLLDSLVKNDALLRMIDKMTRPQSFFRVNLAAGNDLFCDQNSYLQSFENNPPLIFTPSLEYDHKSGWGISATGFLYTQHNNTRFYQYVVSPSYTFREGKIIDAFISYAHYFEQDVYTSNASPVQDEGYARVMMKKSWLKPALSVAYDQGIYHDVVRIDTAVTILGTRVHIHYVDSVATQLRSFSTTASVEHTFAAYDLLSSKDGILITPQFSLFGGVNSYSVTHTSSLTNYISFTKLKLKRIRHFQSQQQNSGKFELQSAAFALDVNYAIGKFYLEPQLYMDYYLPQTNDNRLTVVYNFNIGITF